VLLTQEPMLRRFWHCLFPISDLGDKPQPFRLLGENIVVWKDADGAPHAVQDRCPHKTAKLSLGYLQNGDIVCPYHGWAFDGDGLCTLIPQELAPRERKVHVRAYHCAERYGQVWVCLDEPALDIPDVEPFKDPSFRQVFEFSEDWACSPLRIMENEFDAAHLSFVHATSFGNTDPIPALPAIESLDDGFIAHSQPAVRNPEGMRSALHMTSATTVRTTTGRYYVPFLRVTEIAYPNGLKNILVTALTPIDDRNTRFNQFVLRNDTEEQVSSAQVIAFDRRVTLEDKVILESTDPDVPLDASEDDEEHMASDRPGLLMRKKIRAFCDELRKTGGLGALVGVRLAGE
jgi:phenylpropionate dioxygenase-like ring-hydroxylating dioxygenase large terminal subunit